VEIDLAQDPICWCPRTVRAATTNSTATANLIGLRVCGKRLKPSGMKTMLVPLLVIVGLAAMMLVGCQSTRAGYESAPYQVVRTNGLFEIRDYPAMQIVETPMASPNKDADGGFMRLFRYISGSNTANQKISMTTPVYMNGSVSNSTMSFVLPADMKASDIPKPVDGSITVKELAPGRFAVLRFKGSRNAGNEKIALDKLQAWLTAEGLKSLATPIYGYFDPPWTPPFLRRNEVMLRIE
jgi:DNA gyrase inhibitor GyrI